MRLIKKYWKKLLFLLLRRTFGKRITDIQNIKNIATRDGNWNFSPYLYGMANGILLCEANLRDIDCEFLSPPKVWLDKTLSKKGEYTMKIGDLVTFVNPVAQECNALVTAVWGEGETPSLNLVIVSENGAETDSYGRQIKRETSVVHQSMQFAHGNYWKPVE